MNAPDNIYINDEVSLKLAGDHIKTTGPVYSADLFGDLTEYIRADLYAAVEAERDELRRQRDLLVASLAECYPYMKDEETPEQCIKRNRDDTARLLSLLADERRTVEQLRARLDAVAIAEPKP